jgi:pimeloyl-ACP methyl ester carboxylesterase
MLFVLAATAALLFVLGVVAARFDRPPARPGAWLAESGLEARFLTVGGHRLRYVRTGRGPAVVLVHGFASSLYTWKEILPALEPVHDVVALDLPGFGGSARPADLSFRELPEAVLGLMDGLEIGRAALVGNSMGGAVAAVAAAEQPGRVTALVLIDAAGFNLGPGEAPAMVRLAMSPIGSLIRPLPLKRLAVEWSLREVFHDDAHVTDERVAEYMDGLQRPGALASIASLGRSLGERDRVVQESLPRIQAPTLVVWGREDRWIPVAHADRFVEAIPGARKVVLDACGHMPQAEKPEEVGRLLRESFRSGPPRFTWVLSGSGRSWEAGFAGPPRRALRLSLLGPSLPHDSG